MSRDLPVATDVRVTGGVAGPEATWARLELLAADEEGTARTLALTAARTAADAAHPRLAADALLAPATAASAAEAALALGGAAAATAASAASWATDAARVRVLLAWWRAADEATAADLERLRLGLALPWPSPPSPALAMAPAAGPLAGATVLPLLAAALGHPRATAAGTSLGAGMLGAAYADPPVRVRRRRDLEAGPPPDGISDLADVVARLEALSALSDGDHPDGNGTLEVQTFVDPDGEVRHVAYLPGTDDMTTLPWTADQDVRDMGTNLRLVGDLPNGYADGVVAALREAGVRPGEPVLLAGHSQGGLVAAQLVAHADETGLDLDRAVTLGAPVAGYAFPDDARVLSLENTRDLVPLLDGAANAGSSGHVTVVADAGERGGPAGAHGFAAYAAVARATDASADPSVRAAVASLRAEGWLSGASPTRRMLVQVLREPG
ncbi:hypothetical protein [Nocardioides sp. GY 10127]|uniref:hypothetical protein n=1 Tax=Nocardioides sp. GY 10127 TaxID=2569762 RepID=UPI001458BD98|nr:hypothetical protein [Nocardioides sp. GY 10127]